ncbi:MAG: hypothetical protein RXP92_02625 [Candidatus Micrarchaeota archaeon]
MEYGDFIKQKYMKLALKGIKLPLEKQWEKSLIGVQCLFALNAKLMENAMKTIEQVDEEFNNGFSNGLPLPFDSKAEQAIPLYLKVEHYLKLDTYLVATALPRLSEPIIQSKNEIDNSIYVWFVGNKKVLEDSAEEAKKQIKQIENSLHDCFKNDQKKVEEIRESMKETHNKVNADIKSYVENFANALDLKNIIFDVGVLDANR